MKILHLNLTTNEKKEKEYRSIFCLAGSTYMLVVKPLVRLGCKTLTEPNGAITVSVHKKNESYGQQFLFADQLATHTTGGKNLAKLTITAVNKVLINAKVITSTERVLVLSFIEGETRHYLKSDEQSYCDRCLTPVSFQNVSDGYDAYCPYHDEDLLKVEII